jgi:aminodeoxyfutalosine deaminase
LTIDAAAFGRHIPKAELHVHLEGTITPQAFERIAKQNDIEAADIGSLFQCSDFHTFLQSFLRVVRALRTPLDFAELAYDYLSRSADAGVRHVEMFLSPATQRKFVPDLDLEAMVAAVGEACSRARADRAISSLLIFDMVRNLGEPSAMQDIDLALKCRQHGVIGVGLGGDERNFRARDFQNAFARAREEGLRRTVHAGEAAGAHSIVDAVELLGAERIGHGVAARANPHVLALLRDRGVTIDACPTSNRFTGAVARDETHPLREFLDAGVAVTLNSDDPAFFHTTVDEEYANAPALGCGVREIAAIARSSFERSFLPESEKRALLDEVDAYVDAGGITR